MGKIAIEPHKIAGFGSPDGAEFVLLTNTVHRDAFEISKEARAHYSRTRILYVEQDHEVPPLLDGVIGEPAHILTILTECLLQSIPREKLGKRKLLIMACRSGKTNLEGIRHFLEAGCQTDPATTQARADDLFDKGAKSAFLSLVDEKRHTAARFDHRSDEYEWHEQAGYLDWGDQQVFPAGEVACFLVPLYTDSLPERRFELTGQMVLNGPNIVQSGPPSFLLDDQLRIHRQLMTTRDAGVMLEIERGIIVGHRALSQASAPAERILTSLFEVDSRYRHIYEVGFSLNPYVSLWEGNSAMNEVWGPDGGRIHLGLGMLPYTQYHVDAFCADTCVKNDAGEVIFGMASRPMKRLRSSACPCTPL